MITMQIEGASIIQIGEKFTLTKGRVSQVLNREENQRLKRVMLDRIALARADEIIARDKGRERSTDTKTD